MKSFHDEDVVSVRMMKWVKLKRYCEVSGDTQSAVHAKRKKGIWIDGQHCVVAEDGNLWIDLGEVERWVEHGSQAVLAKVRQVSR